MMILIDLLSISEVSLNLQASFLASLAPHFSRFHLLGPKSGARPLDGRRAEMLKGYSKVWHTCGVKSG